MVKSEFFGKRCWLFENFLNKFKRKWPLKGVSGVIKLILKLVNLDKLRIYFECEKFLRCCRKLSEWTWLSIQRPGIRMLPPHLGRMDHWRDWWMSLKCILISVISLIFSRKMNLTATLKRENAVHLNQISDGVFSNTIIVIIIHTPFLIVLIFKTNQWREREREGGEIEIK